MKYYFNLCSTNSDLFSVPQRQVISFIRILFQVFIYHNREELERHNLTNSDHERQRKEYRPVAARKAAQVMIQYLDKILLTKMFFHEENDNVSIQNNKGTGVKRISNSKIEPISLKKSNRDNPPKSPPKTKTEVTYKRLLNKLGEDDHF